MSGPTLAKVGLIFEDAAEMQIVASQSSLIRQHGIVRRQGLLERSRAAFSRVNVLDGGESFSPASKGHRHKRASSVRRNAGRGIRATSTHTLKHHRVVQVCAVRRLNGAINSKRVTGYCIDVGDDLLRPHVGDHQLVAINNDSRPAFGGRRRGAIERQDPH